MVGTKVLSLKDAAELQPGRELRVYAFCSASNTTIDGSSGSSSSGSSSSGSVTLVVLNTATEPTSLQTTLPGTREVFMLTSYPNVPTSRDVFLNERVLQLLDQEHGTLPPLVPTQVPTGAAVIIPAQSYGFVVHPGADAAACK